MVLNTGNFYGIDVTAIRLKKNNVIINIATKGKPYFIGSCFGFSLSLYLSISLSHRSTNA